MPSRRSLASLALAATATLAGTALAPSAQAADPYTVQTLHFKVNVGPNGSTVCDVVGDLYLPTSATPTSRVPAILTTNGFGGSKNDQAGIGRAFSSRGYAVLSYSGLGFGGSDCKITLDDPDWDGKAASQLIGYLGGAAGVAFTDDAHTTAAPTLDVVKLDAPGDPRVGMVGGSYGGQIQFAAASVDSRLDTIVPIITWNDLSYALGPNNTAQTSGVSTSTPGATKLTWGLFFSGLGVANGVQNGQTDPGRLLPCPNFATFVCPALVTAGTLGYFDPGATEKLRHASVASYMAKIKIPTLLMQGQNDTLFNLNEAIATYKALKAQDTPVTMIWQSWGHSNGTAAPGEINLSDPDPATQYQSKRVIDWFEKYLKDAPISTGPEFSYFRDWVAYSGNASAAYASASSYPVGTTKNYYLSGTKLSTSSLGLLKRSQTFVTPVAGAPTAVSPLDALGSVLKLPVPELDLPGTFAWFDSPALTSKVDVVGSPTLTVKLLSPTAALTQGSGPAGQLVLFVRIQDRPPTGAPEDIRMLTAPIRVPDVNKPFTVTLPAFVHRFEAGHKIRLVVAGASLNYRGGLTANTVSIQTGTTAQVLKLPTVN